MLSLMHQIMDNLLDREKEPKVFLLFPEEKRTSVEMGFKDFSISLLWTEEGEETLSITIRGNLPPDALEALEKAFRR